MEQEITNLNIDNMTALDLIEALLDQIAENGGVGLQFEEGGKILYCSVEDPDELTETGYELTSTKPLH